MTNYQSQSKKMKQLERDTGFERVCCVCYEFKSQSMCTYKSENLLPKEQEKYCTFNNQSKNTDGRLINVCAVCKKKLKQDPVKVQRDLINHMTFPTAFQEKLKEVVDDKNNVHLNKLEQHIIKLVIPFIRVAYLQGKDRANRIKVRGNIIMISADVVEYLTKIIPRNQQLLAVKFKRKLTYDGHVMHEIIDKKKVELYFHWLRNNNNLFEDLELNEGLFDDFERQICIDALEFERNSIPTKKI